MKSLSTGAELEVSVVVPIAERRGDLKEIFREYSRELRRLRKTAEFIFVVNKLDEPAVAEVRDLTSESAEEVSLVLLRGDFGEATLLNAGFDQARGQTILTLAAYEQVGPEGLERAFALLGPSVDIVVGRRFPRVDSAFNRLQNWLFHRLVGFLTSTSFNDVSCGFRLMKRVVAEKLKLYGGLYRFIPLLAWQQGFSVCELPLRQRQEEAATRYYGLATYLKRILDILSLVFLMRFTRSPLRFFGLLGIFIASAGFIITGWLGVSRLAGAGGIADRPLLLLGVLLMVLGVQTLSLGLIGEIIIFTHAREIREYRVSEVIRQSSNTEPPAAVQAAETVASKP